MYIYNRPEHNTSMDAGNYSWTSFKQQYAGRVSFHFIGMVDTFFYNDDIII
jgi:hypothetical protein